MKSNSTEKFGTNWDWVDPQVLNTQSSITNPPNLNPFNFLQPTLDSSTVSFLPCTPSERVCFSTLHLHDHNDDFFYLYEIIFTHFGLRLPFSDFQLQILNAINVAPTQLHPEAWAFVISFENLCQSFRLAPSVAAFFYFFQVVKEKEKMSWVSIRAHEGQTKILVFDKWYANFSNQFFRVEGRRGSALPFFVGENKKPKFPLYWTRMIQSPKPPQSSSLSPSEKDLVDKLQRLKEPFQCAFYVPLNTNAPLKISPLHAPNSNGRRSKQVVEVTGGVEKRKQFVTSTPEQRKNQRVLVENSPTSTPPPPPPVVNSDMEETGHLCGFEGDGAGLPSCVQGHALDSNGLISHSMGHVDLGSFLQGLFLQGMEVIQKRVSQLESELNEERSARKKAEGKVAEMKKELARCEGELASTRRDCETLHEIQQVLRRISTTTTTTTTTTMSQRD
ncbi:hypothetical protein Ahy_A10g048947 [Arachis hypogaea]|uniref:Transposase (putative) gypsy type domain-containing protein n=1 Tax=Arachis hypogaea TaxID=3818 RepID=A0A445B6F3_ARAHY|nr:hypothetical protein Ahy_A10g048947 [Arachis hypogaea]